MFLKILLVKSTHQSTQFNCKMGYSNREFKSFPKPEKKVKKTAAENWRALKVRAMKKQMDNAKQFIDKDASFYNEIWKENLHICSVCNCDLGATWRKWNFHHLKPKAKFPKLRWDKDNIVLICLTCHSNEHS